MCVCVCGHHSRTSVGFLGMLKLRCIISATATFNRAVRSWRWSERSGSFYRIPAGPRVTAADPSGQGRPVGKLRRSGFTPSCLRARKSGRRSVGRSPLRQVTTRRDVEGRDVRLCGVRVMSGDGRDSSGKTGLWKCVVFLFCFWSEMFLFIFFK